ncbi:MAG: efflux RND transporter periplasmic adaptor subunit [Myxococcales bacterium FL481]|nr:MAG: efflux RND transporter periplasmic adaptor subunit [Myxococcales bacterium FL481]
MTLASRRMVNAWRLTIWLTSGIACSGGHPSSPFGDHDHHASEPAHGDHPHASQPDTPGHHDDVEPIAITVWTDQTELFVEFPALVLHQASGFAAHLTRLEDFSAVATGRVEVVLSGGGAEPEHFGAGLSPTAGIFRPVVRPAHAVTRDVAVVLETDQGRWSHALGQHAVASHVDKLVTPAPVEDDGIRFLKEQQWNTPFSTAEVTVDALRPSFPVFAHLVARADGEVTIPAPATGRLIAAVDPLPVVGATVHAGDVLARFLPRLGGEVDVPTLDLAVTAAHLDLQQAAQERTRLEGLLADGAVAKRRVVQARHAHATAEAQLAAARRRAAQYRRVQRTAPGKRGASVEVQTPLTGTVLEVGAVPGALVEGGAPLFRIVDASTLWLAAQVPEVDQARIPEVSGVWMTVPGETDPIELGPQSIVTDGGPVDPITRTITMLFAVPNPAGRLRVGTRVRAHLVTQAAAPGPSVPAAAVIVEDAMPIVFVQTGGESFERRAVRTGQRDGRRIAIEAGVSPGERVVVEGAYLLKLAASGTQAPAHGHPH